MAYKSNNNKGGFRGKPDIKPYEDEKRTNEKLEKPRSNDFYSAKIRSQKRTVSIDTQDGAANLSTVYPAVGQYNKTFDYSSKANQGITDSNNLIDTGIYNAINAKTGIAASRIDALVVQLTHRYMGFVHETVPFSKDGSSVSYYTPELLKTHIKIEDEKNSLIQAYQMTNLNILAWAIVPYEAFFVKNTNTGSGAYSYHMSNEPNVAGVKDTLAYKIPVAYKQTRDQYHVAFNAAKRDYQILLRNLAIKCLQLKVIYDSENELTKNEYNFNYAAAVAMFAELKRSRYKGKLTAIINFIKNEWFDIENFKYELVPLIIPSRSTDGMDSVQIQFSLFEEVTGLSYSPISRGKPYEYTYDTCVHPLLMNEKLRHIDCTLASLQYAIRSNDPAVVNDYLSSLYQSLVSMVDVMRQIPTAFSDLRSAFTTLARAGLLNLSVGYDLNKGVSGEADKAYGQSQVGPVSWSLVTDMLKSTFTGLDYRVSNGTSAVHTSDTAKYVIDSTTRNIKGRTLWTDTDGISTYYEKENYIPWVIQTEELSTTTGTFVPNVMASVPPTAGGDWTSEAVTDIGVLNRIILGVTDYDISAVNDSLLLSELGWSFCCVPSDAHLLTRNGDILTVEVKSSSGSFSAATSIFRGVSSVGDFDSAPIKYPYVTGGSLNSQKIDIESKRAMSKLFLIGEYGDSAGISNILVPEAFVAMLPMDLRSPQANIDNYLRQNSSYVSNVTKGGHND